VVASDGNHIRYIMWNKAFYQGNVIAMK